ncbi:hypothetical protein H6P81_012820 [Aristolochia fimbriata]|uniref:MULE transposase domain-containing protein n=1 Tax=Aristolochia fimbriata TaxID=158543 RepID=A0AAV7ECX7_ARIFI|nr:hypothetical protein H6P81_012820 [Aristolochia fimbriata]
MMYNVLGGNPRTDHISIWLSFTYNGRLLYTPVLDDVSLENGIGMVKHGFQSMLELFVKQDTYSYEMDSRRSLENVSGTGEGAVMVYGGQAPAEGDEIVERPIAEFIPEEREPSEEANDNSSSKGPWPEPVTDEDVEEEEDVKLLLPTMGVPPLEENDESYPDPWIGVMDMDVTYRNTMVPGVDDDNVPPPVGVGVGQRVFWAFGPAIHGFQFCRPFISVDGTHLYGKYKGCLLIATSFDGDNWLFPLAFALVETKNIDTWTWFISCLAHQVVRGRSPMCIISDRHNGIIRAVRDVFPRPHRHRFCIRHIVANLKKRYSVKDLNKMVWRCASAETVAHYDHEMQILEEACPGAKAGLTEDMSPGGGPLHTMETCRDGRCPIIVRSGLPQERGHLAWRVMGVGTSTYWTSDTPRGTGATGWPLSFQSNATNPGGNLVLYRTELDHQRSYQVNWQSYLDLMQRLPAIGVEGRRIWLSTTPLICFEIVELHVPDRVMLQFGGEQVTPPEDVDHVTRISRKGQAGEDWALYHRDYIARWEARAEYVVMGSRAHTTRHAPSDYMRWYLGATRRFIAPPPTEPAMVYHPRGYTEEALLGCVRNVVERVNHRAALYPSSTVPHWLEIGYYCQSVLHSLPLLEGAIVGGDESHAGEPSHMVEPAKDRAPRRRRARHRPTAEMTTPVEDSDEVPAVPEPTVLDLPPQQTPDTELGPPLEHPLE